MSPELPAPRSRHEVQSDYERRVEVADEQIRSLSARSTWLTAVRGLLLLASAALLITGWFRWGAFWWPPGTVVGLAFIVVAAIQENGERLLRNVRTERNILSQSLAGMARKWDAMRRCEVTALEDRTSMATDLDLVGNASLYQLVGVARTPFGMETLRNWLLTTPRREDSLDRQEAVKQIAPMSEWRNSLQLNAEQLASSKSGPDALIEWAESEPWLGRRRILIWIVRLLTAGLILTSLLLFVGGIDKNVGGVTIVVICACNFALTVIFAGSIHTLFNQVSSRHNDVAHYRRLFRLVDSLPSEGRCLEQIHQDASYGGRNAFHQIVVLGQIMAMANLRRAGFFGAIYLILQFLILWDFHALDVLERWQKRCGKDVRRWFEALGRAEAIACLAKLAYEEPDWTYPEIVEYDAEKANVEATDLGHPLIAENVRVSNDVTIGPVGSVLLVTGSNMSGKSTLLRAVGVNISLAHAGTVVSAKSLVMPILRVETSMRISDSLSDGVSFFMAELKRLKQVVDLAEETRNNAPHGFFYLLDEILQGTNSRERHIAVQEVIRHLIEVGALGAVSTHDLDLASAPGLADYCHPIHFREQIEIDGSEKKMTFDYILREGVATTSNALKLLALVGLHDEKVLLSDDAEPSPN